MDETKPKVLIVEDEFIVAIDLKKTLQNLNYKVTSTVDNGEQAIEKAVVEKPDIILMDITLRGCLDGIETAQIIMSKSNIPVIYLTALNDEETIDRALATKPYGYLFKPFDSNELYKAIESALIKSQTVC